MYVPLSVLNKVLLMLLLMPGIISTSCGLCCWCDSYAQGTSLVVKQQGIQFASGKIDFSRLRRPLIGYNFLKQTGTSCPLKNRTIKMNLENLVPGSWPILLFFFPNNTLFDIYIQRKNYKNCTKLEKSSKITIYKSYCKLKFTLSLPLYMKNH